MPSSSDENSCSTSEEVYQLQCRVCKAPSDGPHFGIQACRACSAFFRRSVVENRRYKCSQYGKCKISTDVRNSCRSCRFTKCVAAGMRTDKVQQPRDLNRNISKQPTTFRRLPKTVSPPTTRIIDRLAEGYRRYSIAHEAIFSSIYPDTFLKDDGKMIVLPLEEKLKLDSMLVPTMYKLMKEFFVPYATIAKPYKFDLLMRFMQNFHQLECAYLSAVLFPDRECAMALSRHDYTDKEHLDFRFKNVKNKEESLKTFEPVRLRFQRLIKKVKSIQMSEFEFLCLVGIVTSGEVINRLDIPEAYRERNNIFNELYENCKENYDNPDLRFGKLLLLIRDCEELSSVFKECVFMAMFLDDIYKDTIDRIRAITEKLTL
ncbi:unnamed protein product [Bursaphelenchus xylophilus]|uniref:(pine wood nematode) hypothetical protein n=1 Tax=Bursaphelenchus xylophilus TaxID=6326 RepID=A0A1I7SFS5_BURXY|nr:unnamed protein product [Bursaphelenchus xylophilus]CAG9114355.1 unnamed protein product [Bursaphelenchus xylophilus]